MPIGQLSIPYPGTFNTDESVSPGPSTIENNALRLITGPPSSPPSESPIYSAFWAILSAFWAISSSVSTPQNIKQAMESPDHSEWQVACLKELEAFKSHSAFSLVPLPSGRLALGTRWVFTVKYSGLKKARLVAQGFRQTAGIDYQETFAPVIRYNSVRIFLAVSCCLKLIVHQMDVDTAFLNSNMDEPVYIRQPPGFINPTHPDHVWKLHGGMYGLKQAPLLWNKHINQSLLSIGFTRHEGEYGLYFRHCKEGIVLLTLYVDDLLIASPSDNITNIVKSKLREFYSMKDLGPVSKFLGMDIQQYKDYSVTLILSSYISKSVLAQETPLHKPVLYPLSPNINYLDDSSPIIPNITDYQSIVGQLIFIANAGRPDIAYSISLLSRFLKSSRDSS